MTAEEELRAAAVEYEDAFASTDPKKMSDRRQLAHLKLCRAARRYGFEQNNLRTSGKKAAS